MIWKYASRNINLHDGLCICVTAFSRLGSESSSGSNPPARDGEIPEHLIPIAVDSLAVLAVNPSSKDLRRAGPTPAALGSHTRSSHEERGVLLIGTPLMTEVNPLDFIEASAYKTECNVPSHAAATSPSRHRCGATTR